jgi:peptide/nickel transport system substrate-binding protein
MEAGLRKSNYAARQLLRTAAIAVVVASSLVIGSAGISSASHSKIHDGGTAVYALRPGTAFNFLGPFNTVANCEVDQYGASAGSWRNLYYATGDGGIDYKLSLAGAPDYKDGNTVVTVTLNHTYKWTTGTPVTTKDIRFFFQILANQPLCYAFAGLLPKDVSSITFTNSYSFTLHLNHSYNPRWFTENQLQWITPIPAQAWDRTCATCPDGNKATTPAGAKSVTTFLMGEFRNSSTYSTNPLWKVVDGPWVISSYNPVTKETTFVRNTHYTGPTKAHLSAYTIVSFTTGAAETNALRSGTLSMGFLTPSEYDEIPYFKSHGYDVVGWPIYGNNAVELGYTNPTYGPLVKQLYIRQALQHLITEKLYISRALHGFAQPDYGSLAVLPEANVVSPSLSHPFYAYSPSAATKLLSSHGWKLGSDGIDYCARVGSGPRECGAGISSGKQLSLLLIYGTGSTSVLAETEAFEAAARKVGVHFTLKGESEPTIETEGECPPGPCNYGLLIQAEGELWTLGLQQGMPTGTEQFGPGAFYSGGYSNSTAFALMKAADYTSSGSLAPWYSMENYLSKNLASLWLPLTDSITVVSPKLKGWSPLNPDTTFEPQFWYFAGQ